MQHNLAFLFFSFAFLKTEGVIKQDDDELRLINDLFSKYNKEVRPVKNKSQAIEVVFGIAYTQLVELVRDLKT